MYYLRARYMEPGSGRFWGMDAWEGDMGNPLSLNKYAYVIADPINFVDPSGFSPMQERAHVDSISHRLRLSSVSTVRVNVRTVAANDALWATRSAGLATMRGIGVGITTALAVTSSSRGADRFAGVPMIVFGREFQEHAEHIRDAQVDGGSNLLSAPFALNRMWPWPRGWYNMAVECNNAAREKKPGRACDEYPFASSRQGGPVNYMLDRVSLRLLDKAESDGTRDFIREFYNTSVPARDGFSPLSRFVALGIPGIDSFYTDRQGMVHYWSD